MYIFVESKIIMLRGHRSLTLREGFFYAKNRIKIFGILSCIIVVMAVVKLLNKVFDNRDNRMPFFLCLISKCFLKCQKPKKQEQIL